MTRLTASPLALVAVLAVLAGCNGGSSSYGTDNSVTATASVSGTVSAAVGGAGQPVSVSFNASDNLPAFSLSLTDDLSAMPAGWHSAQDTFTCTQVSTGNGCMLDLSYAPTAAASGTLSLHYAYTDNAGTSKHGEIAIPFSASADSKVVGTAFPAGQVTAVVNASQAVTVSFTTDDGGTATDFELTSQLGSLPAGWSSTANGLTCAKVDTGTGCHVALTYAPLAHASGTLGLSYSYTDNGGIARTGTLNIPYAGTTHDNVVAAVNPSGTVTVNTGTTQSVTVTFTTDDGNPASALSMTSGLTSLPTGWTTGAASFGCSIITTGAGCRLDLTYAPTAGGNGTLHLGFGYSDDSGAAKTGSVSIPYLAQTVHLYISDTSGTLTMCSIGAAGVPANCTAAASGITAPESVVFTSTHAYVADGAVLDVCNVNANGTLSGCAVTVGSGFNGFVGNLALNGNAVYAANINAYYGPLYCVIQSDATLASCTNSNGGGGNNQATGTAFYGQYAYVSTVGDNNLPGVFVCAVGNNGALSNCVNAGSGLSSANGLVADESGHVYVVANGIEVCTSGIGGALTGCQTYAGTQAQNPYYVGLAIYGGYAYVLYGSYDPNTSIYTVGISVCTANTDGSLTACADSGVALNQNGNPYGLTIH